MDVHVLLSDSLEIGVVNVRDDLVKYRKKNQIAITLLLSIGITGCIEVITLDGYLPEIKAQ